MTSGSASRLSGVMSRAWGVSEVENPHVIDRASAIPDEFESQLTEALQPIRQAVLAHVLVHFFEQGWYEPMAEEDGTTVPELAARFQLNEERLLGLVRYLANEDIVTVTGNRRVKLSERGRGLVRFWPWYTLLIGGYGAIFNDLPVVLGADGPYATRNDRSVAVGSCGISQYDALPITRRLLSMLPNNWRTVVDIGCGDGTYLVDLCASLPAIQGIGLELDPATVELVRKNAERMGVVDRVKTMVAAQVGMVPELPSEDGPFCFITAFVLQEMLEQSGREAIIQLLTNTFERYPDSHWIVVEVDHRPDDPTVMSDPLGLAYYNPYYLIHQITEQRLESLDYWHAVFADAHLDVVATQRADHAVDAPGLKVGFLLRLNRGAQVK